MGLWRRHGGRGRGACRPVEIQVWHTLTDANKAEFEKLAKQYNKEQDQVSVTLRAFASQAQLRRNHCRGQGQEGPNLLQLADNRSPEVVAEHKAVMPMYELLAKYPIKDLNWYVPATSSFVRDGKGRLLAFPGWPRYR